MGKIEKKLGNDGNYLARVCKETTKCESEEQLKILSPCPEEIIASVRVTNDYLASPCFSKYSWSRIHSRSQMILSNKVTSWTSLSLSLLPPDQVLSILSTGTCHLSSNSFMSTLETSNLLARLYLKREKSHVTVQSLAIVRNSIKMT
jgi:hypothetical protein